MHTAYHIDSQKRLRTAFLPPALSCRGRKHRQGAGQEVGAGGGEGRAGEEIEPQGARRHQGEHRGAAVLQGDRFQVTDQNLFFLFLHFITYCNLTVPVY